MKGRFAVLVAALAFQRTRELALSRRLERSRPGQRAAYRSYPLMVAVHMGLLLVPPLEIRLAHRRPRGAWAWVAVLVAATGLRRWSIQSLGDQWNVHAAVPDDLRPVVNGPYRWIRHPNYLAVVLEFAALPMAGGAWVSAIALSALDAAVLFDRISAEEKLLFRSPAYQEAFASKPRFIPGIF